MEDEDEEERVNEGRDAEGGGGEGESVEGTGVGLESGQGVRGVLRRSRTHTRTELACSPRLRLRRSLAI